MRALFLCGMAMLASPALLACGSGDSSNQWDAGSGSGSSSSGGSSSGGSTSSSSSSGSTGGSTSSSGGTMRDAGSPPREAGGGSSGADASSGSSSGSGSPDGGDDGGNAGSEGGSSDGSVSVPAIKAVMYLPNWAGSYSSWAGKIDFNKMTHLLLAFGTVTGTNGWDLGAQDSDVQALAAAAHAKNVKVLVSIGGADGDITIINAYGDASNVTPLVANLDSMVSRLNLDGVDVDLERGNMMQSSSNYPAFVKQLLMTFHPEGKLVTTALAQYIVQDANPDATITGVVNSFDFINDMIYTTNYSDYTNESNWWTSTVNLPKGNLVWGIEFSGGLSTDLAKQITMGSLTYGGIMMWDYTQSSEGQLWPAVQSAL